MPTPRLIEVSSPSAHERGVQYGGAAADLIARALAYYREVFAYQAGLDWAEALEYTRRWGRLVERRFPELVEEMTGIAEGAGVRPAEIVALNCRGELLYDNWFVRLGSMSPEDVQPTREETDGCTSFALTGPAAGDGHVYAGQNWDWRHAIRDTVVVLRVVQPPKPTVVMQVEAGQVGRHGANSTGLALNANGLGGRFTDTFGMPQTVLRRAVLDSRNITDALWVLVHTPAHIASNALLTHREGFAIDVETTPGGHGWEYPVDGLLVHGNHYQAFVPPQLAGTHRPMSPDSLVRVPRARQGLRLAAHPEKPVDVRTAIHTAMSDHLGHPDSLCGTPDGKDACTGPFALTQWSSGKEVVLTRAPNYWDAAHAAKTGEITFRWMSDDAIVNSMVTGAADGVYLENLASATQLAAGGQTTVSQGPDTRVWSMMATERGPLKDPRVRNALSLALDRDGVNRAALGGLGQPWQEPVGSGAWGYQKEKFQAAYDQLTGAPASPSKDDLEQAKKLVAEAGPVAPIIVASDGSPVRGTLANALVDAAAKIGLKASIVTFPTAQYGEYYDSPEARQKADLYSDDYYISKNDPVGFYKNGASTSSVQWLLKDPAYDALVQQARATLDENERADLAIEMARRWAQARPWISAVQSPSTVVLSAKVTGVPASGAYRYYPWAADLGSKAS